MGDLLLIAAEAGEFSGLLRAMPHSRRLAWPVDFARASDVGGRRWLLVANGAGRERARLAVREAASRERIEAVVSVGYCGALDPALRAGDLVAPSSVTDGRSEYPSHGVRTTIRHAAGVLFSTDHFVGTVEEKRRLRVETGAAAVDMESAAVAAEAGAGGLRFFCVRAVTDTAEEGFACDLDAMRDGDGRFSRARIVRAALRRPRALIPELWLLGRRSRTASAALAEFLRTCEF